MLVDDIRMSWSYTVWVICTSIKAAFFIVNCMEVLLSSFGLASESRIQAQNLASYILSLKLQNFNIRLSKKHTA